jgi:hypothetical protein
MPGPKLAKSNMRTRAGINWSCKRTKSGVDMLLPIVISLVVGALATSTAEYVKNYNLIDLFVEKVKSLFGKAETEVKTVEAGVIGRLKKI